MVTFTINIPQMLAYIPYMDPMGVYTYTLISPSRILDLITVALDSMDVELHLADRIRTAVASQGFIQHYKLFGGVYDGTFNIFN